MRIAVTIAETKPGSDNWKVIGGPGPDVQGQKDALKNLPGGDDKAMILSTSGVLKRRKIELPGAAKKAPPAKK